MSRFGELNKQKTQVMIDITSNINLLKSIVNKEENFLEVNLPIEIQNDPTIVLYNNIFPYRFPAILSDEEKIIISFGFGNYKKYNNVFKTGKIDFYVLMHKGLIRTDYGLRLDYIINQLDILFNSNEKISIGVLEFDRFDDLPPINDNYIGCIISYKTLEHN